MVLRLDLAAGPKGQAGVHQVEARVGKRPHGPMVEWAIRAPRLLFPRRGMVAPGMFQAEPPVRRIGAGVLRPPARAREAQLAMQAQEPREPAPAV